MDAKHFCCSLTVCVRRAMTRQLVEDVRKRSVRKRSVGGRNDK
jgi:hypothetical protein